MPDNNLLFWCVAVSVALAITVLVYLRCSIAYSEGVKKLLEEYATPDGQSAASAPVSLPPIVDRPLLNQLRNRILQTNQTSGNSDAQLVANLSTALAATQLTHHFSRIHEQMFRSQWNFIRALNVPQDGLASRTSAIAFFEEQKRTATGLGSLTFETWISWLVEKGLVTGTVDNVQLAAAGQEFLIWCIQNRKPEPLEGY